MIIYKDALTGDELWSDTYPHKLVDEVMYEVQGRYVTRKDGEIVLEGANPSQEEADEGTDENSTSGVDIVLDQRLQECFAFGDKKAFMVYLKDYMKKIVERLEKDAPDQVDTFKTNINKVMKDLLGRFKDLQFFTGESMDIDGMVAILEYKDVNGEEKPCLYFFKHGLIPEKV
jgi:hypothetical protein